MSSAAEIIIANPGPQDPRAANAFMYPGHVEELIKGLRHNGINKQSYPRLVDPFTGEGAAADAFKKKDWKSENIVGIDKGLPVNPPPGRLLTWDLEALAHAVRAGETLPAEVSEYQNAFDLLVIFEAYSAKTCVSFSGEILSHLGLFFLRSGGVAYLDMTPLTAQEMRMGWEYVNPQRNTLYRKTK